MVRDQKKLAISAFKFQALLQKGQRDRMVKLSYRWYRITVMVIIALIGAGTLNLDPVHKAWASDCSVEAFSVSPNSPSQAVGTILSLYGRGNCSGGIRASRFNIDGGGFGEDAGAPEQSETWQLTAGAHTICFEIAGGSDGNWSAGASSCVAITGTSAPPSNPTNPSVSGPNINPSGTCRWDVFFFLTGFAPNSTITVSSNYSETVCSTGQQVSSSWSTNVGTTDGSGNFTYGVVHQGTGSYNYTFRDAQGNSRASSFNTSNPNQPPVNPPQPTSPPVIVNPPPQQPTSPPVVVNPPPQTQPPSNSTSCSNAPTQIVSGGQRVQVTSAGSGLRLREQPNTGARILRTIPSGRVLDIAGGFQCGNGYRWWEVGYNGVGGWVADGYRNDHWIEPVSTTSSPTQQPQQPTSLGCQPTSGCIQFVTGSKDRSNNRWWPDRVYQDSAENRQCSADDLDTIIEFDLDYGAWASYDINSFRLYAVYLTRPINELFNGDRQARVPHQSDSSPRLRICVPHQLNGHNFYVWSEDAP